jgi:hypothetical protein
LGIGDWAQSPIPNPQSPIPNPQSPFQFLKVGFYSNFIVNNNNINMNSNAFIQRDKIIYEKLKSSLTLYEEKLVPLKINNIILADESYDEVL